jgi:predicted O-methyltransferase YrrM
MVTGFTQGRFLSLMSQLLNARRILEIGTFTGYGCLCLAEGLTPDGIITTIDSSEENTWLAEKYFNISPYSDKIKLHIGKALEVIPTLNEVWDLVYIDADKKKNLEYLKLCWPSLRQGGIALIDNVFAHGAVLKNKEELKGVEKDVAEMNEIIPGLFSDSTVTVLPVRDGLTLIRKAGLPNFL